jgi:hypothetical protein
MESGKPNQFAAPAVKKLAGTYQQCASTRLRNGRKGCINFLFVPGAGK